MLCGIIGTVDDVSELKKWWNARFLQEELDAFMDNYPTKEAEIPERLSEMYHFDRRGYIVGKPLQKAIIPLLDCIDTSVEEEGRVACIANSAGILTGYGEMEREKMLQIWLAAEKGSDTIEDTTV